MNGILTALESSGYGFSSQMVGGYLEIEVPGWNGLPGALLLGYSFQDGDVVYTETVVKRSRFGRRSLDFQSGVMDALSAEFWIIEETMRRNAKV